MYSRELSQWCENGVKTEPTGLEIPEIERGQPALGLRRWDDSHRVAPDASKDESVTLTYLCSRPVVAGTTRRRVGGWQATFGHRLDTEQHAGSQRKLRIQHDGWSRVLSHENSVT